MKKGSQKIKGSAYELVIAKIFTEIYYPENFGEFKRVPKSGGWDKRIVSGDISAFKRSGEALEWDNSFPFSIECKNWRDVKQFFSGLYSEQSELFNWMGQAINDVEFNKKVPLVVFRLYRQEHIAMLEATDFSKMKEMFGEPECKYYFLREFPASMEEDIKPRLLIFILLKDFLEWIDWEIFRLSGQRHYIRSIIK